LKVFSETEIVPVTLTPGEPYPVRLNRKVERGKNFREKLDLRREEGRGVQVGGGIIHPERSKEVGRTEVRKALLAGRPKFTRSGRKWDVGLTHRRDLT